MEEQELGVTHDVVQPNVGILGEHHLFEMYGLPRLIDHALVFAVSLAILPAHVAAQMGPDDIESIGQRSLVDILRRGEAGDPLHSNVDEQQKAECLQRGVGLSKADLRVGGQ